MTTKKNSAVHVSHFCAVLAVLGLMLVGANSASAQFTLGVIDSATVDYTGKTLTIVGTGFGAGPRVSVGAVNLTVIRYENRGAIPGRFAAFRLHGRRLLA